jgi:hypothetical protein
VAIQTTTLSRRNATVECISRAMPDKLIEPAPGSLHEKLEELREFAVSPLPITEKHLSELV